MTLSALFFLLQFYWPYVLGALVIGLAAGWFSGARRRA